MINAFVCDAIRTPFGRYGGSLSAVRADDLAAVPLQALMARNTPRATTAFNVPIEQVIEIGAQIEL